MLRQQVNLYKYYKEPTATTNYLSWENYCNSLLFACVLFLTIFVIKFWHMNSLQKEDQALTSEASKLQMQFIQFKGKLPPLFFSQDINKTLNQLASDLRLKELVVESIVEQPKFSANLMNFSELIVPNVWLTKFSVDEEENIILLSGHSLSNEDLEKFMSNLSKKDFYRNYTVMLENVVNEGTKGKTDLKFDLRMVEQHG